MKRKILGVFVTVMFGCMVLSGCKKNVGTPEDNAVVENEDEQAQDTETSEGHTFGYSCIDIYNPYYDVVKESIRGELEAKGDLDAAEKIVDEMKQESKLIWSEQEDRNTASSMLK